MITTFQYGGNIHANVICQQYLHYDGCVATTGRPVGAAQWVTSLAITWYFAMEYIKGAGCLRWGLQPCTEWVAMGLFSKNDGMSMSAWAFQGNILSTEVGGPQTTPYHMDNPLRHRTITFDDTSVVINGKVIAPKKSIG